MAAFVLPKRFNFLRERCESVNSKKAIYTHINTKLYHNNIQNNFKIPDSNLFNTCLT